ncbi:MAG: hypothetical protein JNM17_21640, partial [Archangium sp.]|nr:hypothetical protein [Archangium sp.]
MNSYCNACGFPLSDRRCKVCGTDSTARVAEHAQRVGVRVLAPSPADFPELTAAFDAWGKREFAKMVSECLTVCGVRMSKPERVDRGLGWIFFSGSSVVFVVLGASGDLSVESPVVLVPPAQRTPLFRSLLELNVRALGAARFCLRVDRVVLKFSDRVENVAPPKLMAVLREVALAADHFDNLLSHRFSAPMVGPELKKASAQPWQVLGKPLPLSLSERPEAPPEPREQREQREPRVLPGDIDFEPSLERASARPGFEFEPAPTRPGSEFEPPPDDDEVIELARDPYAGRRNPAQPLIDKLRVALATARRISSAEGGLFSLLVFRAVALWGRALMPLEGQSVASALLAALGEHVERFPEAAPRPGVGPALTALEAYFVEVVNREGNVDSPFPEGQVFRLSPFRADQGRTHVRKFMSVMIRCPKDDEARTQLL